VGVFQRLIHYGTFVAILASSNVHADDPIKGLIGGTSGGAPYAATVSPEVEPLVFGASSGEINSVALNGLGQGIIGGNSFGAAYVATLASDATMTRIYAVPATDINAVALNNAGLGLIGGQNGAAAFAATISSNTATIIPLGVPAGNIFSVAINNSNIGIVGGSSGANSYAAIISSNLATPITPGGTGFVNSVDINDSGLAILGGSTGTLGFVSIVPPSSTTEVTIPISGIPISVNAVALNNAGVGLAGSSGIGGAFVDLIVSNTATRILTLPAGSNISSVDINASSQSLVGGSQGGVPYVASISAGSNVVTPISLNFLSGQVNSVSLNDFGQGLIGGQGDGSAFAAIISSNLATPIFLNLANSSTINSVSVNDFLLIHVATSSLSDNNLKFANYINENSLENAIYFVPATFDGSLAQALESAAPTRNAISYNTTMQNSFYLATSLSTHLHNTGFMRSRGIVKKTNTSSVSKTHNHPPQDHLLASLNTPSDQTCNPPAESLPCTIWFEGIGAVTSQKAQHQTPAFHPATGGFMLAFDEQLSRTGKVGVGMAYLHTHINEKDKAGHSDINQESLFLYASWNNQHFYLDGAIWGGLFQTSQKRNIHMTAFNFKSTSSPNGSQVTPHVEFGYTGRMSHGQNSQSIFNPLLMIDWANAWQEHYREHGDSPFNVEQKAHYGSLLRTELGVRFYETLFYRAWNLVFQEKLSYVNTQSFNAGKVNAFIVGSTGSFTVETLTTAQNLAVVQLSMAVAPLQANYPITTIFYQGEYGGSYRSHQINLELGWKF